MVVVQERKIMIYDLQYWCRFSRFPFEKCKNLFVEIHRVEKTRERTSYTARLCHFSPEKIQSFRANLPSTWASLSRSDRESLGAFDLVRRLQAKTEKRKRNLSSFNDIIIVKNDSHFADSWIIHEHNGN